MSSLCGKVAVITGASNQNGIGRAIARKLAGSGASIFLTAEATEEQLKDAARECEGLASDKSARFEYGIYDLAQRGTAEAMIAHADRLFGRIDILVNNAGVRARLKFEDVPRDVFDQAVAVNLAAPFFASQAAVPIMKRHGGGRIIHIASQMGMVTHERRAVYGMTKAGLIHLTKSMAFELAPQGISVNAISPGPTLTDYMEREYGKDCQLNASRNAYMRINRLGRADEIADVALFLAAAAPEALLGENIVVDGGYTIH